MDTKRHSAWVNKEHSRKSYYKFNKGGINYSALVV